MKSSLIFLFLFYPSLTMTANILVLEGLASYSHHLWIKTLTKGLIERGHNVTSIGPDPDREVSKNYHYIHLEKVYETIYSGEKQFNALKHGNLSPWIYVNILNDYFIRTLEGSLKSSGYKQLLQYPNNFRFDLVIYDAAATPVLLAFVHKFNNPPILAISPYPTMSLTESLVGSLFYPSFINYHCNTKVLTDSFFGKVENFLLHFMEYIQKNWVLLPTIESKIKSDFPGLPPLVKLERQTKLLLINCHPAIEVPEPLIPNVIAVGGLQITDPKPLPRDLQTILDSTTNGFVLFSLGTNIKKEVLGNSLVNEIFEAFRQIPQYMFLCKFNITDGDEISIPKNVIVRPWLPQTDLLAHPNIKLFITHGGALSTQESIWYGVPILGIPFFLDQFLNIERTIRAGVAEKFDIRKMSKNDLRNITLKMLQSSKYRENCKKRSKLFRDQPEPPLQRAIWWTEYLLRNADEVEFLQSPSKNLNILQRHSIDVIAFLTVTIIILLYSFSKILKFIFKLFLRRWSEPSAVINQEKKLN